MKKNISTPNKRLCYC